MVFQARSGPGRIRWTLVRALKTWPSTRTEGAITRNSCHSTWLAVMTTSPSSSQEQKERYYNGLDLPQNLLNTVTSQYTHKLSRSFQFQSLVGGADPGTWLTASAIEGGLTIRRLILQPLYHRSSTRERRERVSTLHDLR